MSHSRQCLECGRQGSAGMHRFEGETLLLDGRHTIDSMSGWRCSSCGVEELDSDSLQQFAAASDALVLAERKAQQAELRRIRRKLKLTQRQAAELTGGGHNAFSRYERGEAQPMPAVINLFRLLDRHPELLKEVSKPAAM
ncbi:HTH-type transcriptional regulator / antitoxin MqsA [Azotobacter beijerinckii]|uniref:HTH-type transcriptional regulator / antitoxin MqsA n=1 Tax=Azotobacter beijerinckii TaxID=170623 RepID=A0A1H6URX1_9GAMM|nr:type II toxin-antitoxin system MqsA family antitoxin [Azotobacter beijerinckii]SEI91020.1 HTH-type transcriptional regulator / antitoxin MqsA [Azotobacter beijerinckii]